MYSDLCSIRDLGAVMETLFEILNPLEEGVEGGVAEDMEEEEDDYDGNNYIQVGEDPCD